MSEALEAWARRVLASTPELPSQRLRHSAGVARRAAAASRALLAPPEAELVRAAAWLHDIGYAPGLVETSCHAIDGARHLQRLAAPDTLVGLVAYHSGAEHEAAQRRLYKELAEFLRPPEHLLDLLTYADMTVDISGLTTTVGNRLDGILDRYACGDPVHVSVNSAKTDLVATVTLVDTRLAAGGK